MLYKFLDTILLLWILITKLPTFFWLKYNQKTSESKLEIQMEKLESNLEIQMEKLNLMVPSLILQSFIQNGVLIIVTKSVHLVPLLTLLKLDTNFEYQTLIDIIATDDPKKKLWFIFYYRVKSIKYNSTLVLKVFPDEIMAMPTVKNMFLNASLDEQALSVSPGIIFKGKKK